MVLTIVNINYARLRRQYLYLAFGVNAGLSKRQVGLFLCLLGSGVHSIKVRRRC